MDLVAEFLVSAGGHPAGARSLADASGQSASVINLMEERLRRRRHDACRPIAARLADCR
jgi:hypothetical protein